MKKISQKRNTAKVLIIYLTLLGGALVASADSCYKMDMVGKFDRSTCAPVKVQVAKIDCQETSKILKNYGTREALSACNYKEPRLNIWISGDLVQSYLKEAGEGWGQKTYIIEKTVLRSKTWSAGV